MPEYDFAQAKREYCAFCETGGHDIQVFAQPWYLDAVCDNPEDWRVITVKEGGKIVAAFPFQYKRGKRGFWRIDNPWQAARLGIWMDYGAKAKRQKRESFENEVVKRIILCLPKYDVFSVSFDARFQSWQGFYEAGFTQTTHYSYLLTRQTFSDRYLQELSSSQRHAINSGAKNYTCAQGMPPKECYQFLLHTYKLRSREIAYPQERFLSLYDAVYSHEAGDIYHAITADGEIAAIAAIIWDSRRAYHMAATYDPNMPRGAQPYLVYRAIGDAIASGRDFDFEGSMIPGVAKYNSEFGAIKEPYSLITNYSDRMKLYMNARECLSITKRTVSRVLRKKE